MHALWMQPPKTDKSKKDAGKSKKDKDPVNKSGGKAKKKVCLFIGLLKSIKWVSEHAHSVSDQYFLFACVWFLCSPEQKWSKGKVRDKLNNLVLFDKATYDKLYKEVPNYKLITPAVVSERLKIRGSLVRAALLELLSKGKALFRRMHYSFEVFVFFSSRWCRPSTASWDVFSVSSAQRMISHSYFSVCLTVNK